MGKFSRMKGRREEQQLVLHLAKLDYKAERILRQYQAAGQPDVKATKGDKTITLENKSRHSSFKSIYTVYYDDRDLEGLLCFVLCSSGVAVAMSTDFEKVIKCEGQVFRNLTTFPPNPKYLKVYQRLVGLKQVKQDADVLVLKDNGKPRLFIRYWG